MVVFPNAKINIGLNIVEKCVDGYHHIESCFYPIPLTDALEVIESKILSFSSSGIKIRGKLEDNLCLKAYHLIKANYNIPLVAIHLHKKIPVGAGLGGGSADGAFMIKLLNEKFNLGISTDEQEKLAGKLGSDCPFFIRNKPVYVQGKGAVFSTIDFSLKGYYLVVVLPSVYVSTASAYKKIIPQKSLINLKRELESSSIANFNTKVKNDFEVSVFSQFPELLHIKQKIIESGALYASMSGSGSAIFGIYNTEPKIELDLDFKTFKLS